MSLIKEILHIPLILLMVGILGCDTLKNDSVSNLEKNAHDEQELRIAKQVPEVYFNDADPRFSLHQDTVYFQDQLFTGYRYALNKKSDTIVLNAFFNGVEEGFQKKWYAKDSLEEIRFYINGKKEGLQQGWWPDGKKRFEFTCYNNEYQGNFREWAMNGVKIKDFNYRHGFEDGSQKLWWADGKIRANYVIKGEKKYGLLGYKICANPYDSIKNK